MDTENTINHLKKQVEGVARELEVHKQVENIQFKNMENGISSMSDSLRELLLEMKSNRQHFDNTLLAHQNSLNKKVDDCHDDMMNMLDKNYMTQDAVKVFRDETLHSATKERREELHKAVTAIEKKIEDNHAIVFKSAKSHLAIIWIAAVMFYGMAAYIFMEFKTDYREHEKKVVYKNGYALNPTVVNGNVLK